MAATVFSKSRVPVEPRHHEYVTGLERGQHLAKLGAVSRCPATSCSRSFRTTTAGVAACAM
jgi:hypothetical protein